MSEEIFVSRLAHLIRSLYPNLWAMLILALCSSCTQSPLITYSIDEQYDIALARIGDMNNQLEFSFQLEHDHVPFDQDIFFVATFTNTMDYPLMFREPKQRGVLQEKYGDTTLLVSVKPITEGLSLRYPLDVYPFRFIPIVESDEFVTLPPHGSREIRLQLPRMAGSLQNPFPLPPGQYLVHMTYTNHLVGFEVDLNKFVDINAWVGDVEADPVVLTITPEE